MHRCPNQEWSQPKELSARGQKDRRKRPDQTASSRMRACSPRLPANRFNRHTRMTYTAGQPLAAPVGCATGQQQQQTSPVSAARPAEKTIYLIRHGEGFHNIGYDHNLDAHLTPRGWAQTAELNQHLTALPLGIELVVVSPLRRTLETAAGVFGAKAPPATAAAAVAATATAAAAGATPCAAACSAVIAAAGAAAAGAALDAAMDIGSSSGMAGAGVVDSPLQAAAADELQPLRMVAHEGCRERIGPNVCDKFRDIKLQAADFPGVNFSLLQHSSDEAWAALHDAQCRDGGCYLSGEEEAHCERRALEFYAWLMDRPESVIAVVSHCGFLVHGMRALGKGMFKTWGDSMTAQLKATTAADSAQQTGSSADGFVAATPSPLHAAQGTPYPAHSLAPGAHSSQHAAPAGGHGFEPQQSHFSGPATAGVSSSSSSSGAVGGGSSSSLSGQSVGQAAYAEVVRQSAADLTGWMAADWMNCECRSIQLAWGDSAQLLSGAAASTAAAGVASDGAAAGRFLWARPGESATWFPGGLYGLQ